MKKYVVYFTAQFLSIVSLVFYFYVGNYIFDNSSTAQTFVATSRTMGAKNYNYVPPMTGILGVFIQALGLFLFCICFGLLSGYCKKNLNIRAKHISFWAFGISYVLACLYLFTNNFAMLNNSTSAAIKEIWANAINFFVCFCACVFGFCLMYKLKNKDNRIK